VTPFVFKTNPCGLFLGFEAGEAFSSSTYVPLGCCCDDPPPPPPPPPPPACEGSCEWNYVEGTGWVLVSGGCPEGCYCPQPIDDGLLQSVAFTACVQAEPEPGSCPSPETLYATVTPDGCSGEMFTLGRMPTDVGSVWSGSSPMGSCACPGMPVEYWNFEISCASGAWSGWLASPTGYAVFSTFDIVSTSPLAIVITGTMSCEGPYGQQTFNITITITE